MKPLSPLTLLSWLVVLATGVAFIGAMMADAIQQLIIEDYQ